MIRNRQESRPRPSRSYRHARVPAAAMEALEPRQLLDADALAFQEIDRPVIGGQTYITYDLLATSASDWTNQRIELTLTAGGIYQHAAGSNSPPNPALFGMFPDLEWDTYFSTTAGAAPSFIGAEVTDTYMNVSWFDTQNVGAVTDARVARITVTEDAAGTFAGRWYNIDTAGVGTYYGGVIPIGAVGAEIDVTDDSGDPADQQADLGTVEVGESSAAGMFTLTNSGDQTLAITDFAKGGTNPGDFTVTVRDNLSQVVSGDSFNVPAGVAYTVEVVFTPAPPAGSRSASLTFHTNDVDDDETDVTLSLLGQATLPTTLEVVIGDGLPASAKYTDADGTAVTVTARGGLATLTFDGTGLYQLPGRSITVHGSGVSLEDVALSNEVATGSLTFSTKGGTAVGATVGAIAGDGAFGRIAGRTVDLVGDGIVMTGDGYAATVDVGNLLNGADIVMPGAAAPRGVSVRFAGAQAGTDVTVGSWLKNLTATEWLGGALSAPYATNIRVRGQLAADLTFAGQDASGVSVNSLRAGLVGDVAVEAPGGVRSFIVSQWAAGSLTAGWMGTFKVTGDRVTPLPGDLGADLTLNDPAAVWGLTNAQIAGGVLEGTWSVAGPAGNVRMGWAAENWQAEFAGGVKNLSSKYDLAGQVRSTWINVLNVGNHLTDFDLTLSQAPDDARLALNALKVRGWMDRSQVRSEGNLGTVRMGAMRDSAIYAGVQAVRDDNTDGVWDLFDGATDAFDPAATIRNFAVTGIRGETMWYVHSNIAASSVLVASVRYAQPDAGGEEFGLAAESVGKLTYRDALGATTTLKAPIAGATLDGGFVLRIV